MHIYFYPGLKCNLNCRFCCIGSDNFNIKTAFSHIEEKTSVYLLIAKLIENSNEHVNLKFIGGEPLLYQEDILGLISYLEKKNLLDKIADITINTNGVFLGTFIPKVIKEKWKDKLVIICSLHGMEKIHNFLAGKPIFNVVIKNLLLAKKEKLNFRFYYVVNKLNLLYAEKFIYFFQKYFGPEINGSIGFVDIAGNAFKNKDMLFIDYRDPNTQKIVADFIQKIHLSFPSIEFDGYYPLCLAPKEVRCHPELVTFIWSGVMSIMTNTGSLSFDEIGEISKKILGNNSFLKELPEIHEQESVKYLYSQCESCDMYTACRIYKKNGDRRFHENIHGIQIQGTDYLTTLYENQS